ncbi:MAG: MFS transporter, partial [Clostridiales bacterium]
AIERLFWSSRGMTIQDVVWIEIIYSIVIIILEIPTGYLADKFSRKNLIVIDGFLTVLEILILIYAYEFWQFSLAVIFSGIGHTLQSGSHNSLIYDTLKINNKEKLFETVIARIKIIDYSGIMLSGLLGSWVAIHKGYLSTYWLSLISLIIAFIVSLTLKEANSEKKIYKDVRNNYSSDIIKFVLTNESLYLVTLVGIVLGGVTIYLDEFWQLYFKYIGFSFEYNGYVIIIFSIVIIFANISSQYIKNKIGFSILLKLLPFICFILFIIISFTKNWIGIVIISVIFYFSAVVEPMIYGYLHSKAIDRYRASIESVYSLIFRISVGIIGLPFGFISTKLNILMGFLYLAVIIGIINIILLFKNNIKF